jgi:hypothetical protein
VSGTPNENFKGSGPKTLIDGQLAEPDINNSRWLGFETKDVAVFLEFKKPVLLSSASLNTIVSVNSSVFPPSRIEVYGGPDKNSLKLLNSISPVMPAQKDPLLIKKYDVRFKSTAISCLKIIVKPLKKMPVWHPGKGKPAFMLFDEVLIN